MHRLLLINMDDYKEIFGAKDMQLLYIPEQIQIKKFAGLQTLSKKRFLNTIPSYKAEQMSLNMIVLFLVVISGLLFAIFFYMMNVQKIGLYGILKAIGLKTSTLFKMMWTQMIIITIHCTCFISCIKPSFNLIAPEGMPFHLTTETTILYLSFYRYRIFRSYSIWFSN